MRTSIKSAVVTVAAIACTLPLSAGAAQASPFGSLGNFGSGAPITDDPGTGDPTPAGPQVTLSKSTDIAADGETLTVSGTGFSGEGFGIYVGLVPDDKFSPTDASVWMASEWLRSGDIVDGNWTTTLDVVAIQGESNCLETSCSIYTVAAHGSPDRTQDTQTPVSFVAN
ncbi:hypothetical protein [Rhodococcus xishaensis]|uniref:IPT/TIG domain-containing protein n=1 Tax=Rhodococcus xishaensis TaxID=2487364 RepID=A0A438AYV7_9NOCA|nr:hypothetical protein [Rhodococcus xishaensis]RVW03863.1 hypothetical protein EGT50_04945 [Rhodococcus xishaensis]